MCVLEWEAVHACVCACLCVCVHVCACLCACMRACPCVCVHVCLSACLWRLEECPSVIFWMYSECRPQHLVFTEVEYHLFHLRQGLSLTWSSPSRLGLLMQTPGHHDFHTNFLGLNSGFHVSKATTLPTRPFPRPWILDILYLYCFYFTQGFTM